MNSDQIQSRIQTWEEQYKTQFDVFPIPTYVWRRENDDFTFVDFNEAAREMTLDNVQHAIGEKVSQYYKDRPEVIADFQKCWRTKNLIKREMQYTLKTTERQLWLNVTYAFVPPDMIMVFTEDISERKMAEEELRHSEERYRNIFETAGVSLWELDVSRFFPKLKEIQEQGISDLRTYLEQNPDEVKRLLYTARIVDVNESTLRLFEAESKDELFQAVDVIFLPETYPIIRNTILAAAEGRSFFESESKNRTLKGNILDVLMRMSLPTDPSHINKMFVSVVDITALKRGESERLKLESQIQYAQKLESLGVLAGGIAHDFNNILTGILGNANLALTLLSQDSPVRERIQQIETASLHAADLTNQMLAYAGKGKFEKHPIQFSSLIREMKSLLDVSISKQAMLTYILADDLPMIEADPSQIRQVVLNLVINASEAIGDRTGTITISTGLVNVTKQYLHERNMDHQLPAGKYVCLEVTDTGSGMDEETQSRIFEPFFTTKFTGRGLGLAAVHGIVRSHHGALSFTSRPGQGTAFRTLFPAMEETKHAQKKQAAETPQNWQGDGTVLVIEDEQSVRTVIQGMLEAIGFNVVTAAHGMEGVEVFQQCADDMVAVIIDLTMPGLSGWETYQALRRIRPDMTMIVTSGYTKEIAMERFGTDRFDAYLQKPYNSDHLRELMHAVLHS